MAAGTRKSPTASDDVATDDADKKAGPGRGSRSWTPYAESDLREDQGNVRADDREASPLVAWAIYDAIMRQACDARLTQYEWATLQAIIHETLRYQRSIWTPWTGSLDHLNRWTRIGRGHISQALKRLASRGFITHVPGSPAKSAAGHKQTHTSIRLRVPAGWEAGAPKDTEMAIFRPPRSGSRGEEGSRARNRQSSGARNAQGSRTRNGEGSGIRDPKEREATDQGDQSGETKVVETNPPLLRAAPLRAEGRASAHADDDRQTTASQTERTASGSDGEPADASGHLANFLSHLAMNGHPVAKRFTSDRQRELLEALGEFSAEHELSLSQQVYLVGHWLGYKRGEHANHAHEQFGRITRDWDLTTVATYTADEALEAGVLDGEGARAQRLERERRRTSEPFLPREDAQANALGRHGIDAGEPRPQESAR